MFMYDFTSRKCEERVVTFACLCSLLKEIIKIVSFTLDFTYVIEVLDAKKFKS